jgi:hypothetical protein
MLKPIAPYVEYAINYDYFSKILCINKDKPAMNCEGKCQLMIKLKEKQENDYKSLTIHMEEYPLGFVRILKIKNKKNFSNSKKDMLFFTENYDYLFSKEFFHPPTL